MAEYFIPLVGLAFIVLAGLLVFVAFAWIDAERRADLEEAYTRRLIQEKLAAEARSTPAPAEPDRNFWQLRAADALGRPQRLADAALPSTREPNWPRRA